ncbi:MAG: exodeoxyribonuclease V subunit gamma, partial [Deltaproteobacteria bacterium]|nr:exodeoxyribonuclease V subunit gamma [Deltaproteobacteria bacterium]
IDTFLDALDLCKSRFSASEVMAILESRPVYERFGFSEGDLVLVRRWIKDTGIRWGIDEQSRRRLDLPPLSENTWKAGLDRLVLGYAMPGYDKKLFDGILPYDYVEGGEAVLLGRFLAFCHTLFDYVVSFEQKRRVEEWSELLIRFAEELFLLDEKRETEWQLLKRTLADLADVIVSEESVFDEQIDVAVVRWHLGRLLEEKGFGFGFIDGGITFCAMLPMRSIPFRVICLVGMNGDIYPRQSKIGFDLMAKHPRPGDRSRRRDDRYLFLEAILSARQRLYISYVGQSIKDNSIAPPSVLVSELIDYVEERFEGHFENIFEKIFTKHRLQAFSPEYFKSESKLFGYSKMNYQAARSIGETIGVLPFISKGLDEPGDEWKIVDLRHLCSFFNNGARFLLNRRLGIYLEERQSVLKDQEHFELASLEKYILEQALVEKGLSGEEIESLFPITKASGLLPHGVVGVCLYDNICQDINRFVEKTRPYVLKPKLEPVDVDVQDLTPKIVCGYGFTILC